jgi:hypothetical protein
VKPRPEALDPAALFAGSSLTVGDFWSWAMGDLRDNVLRGVLAEYLVTRALGGTATCRSAWDNFDVLTPTGLKVEVKSTGRLQVWAQGKPSAIRFSGLTGRVWDEATATYPGERIIRADVFVFAIQTCIDPDAYDALDLKQWEFYAAPAQAVRTVNARSVGTGFLRDHCSGPHAWADLRAAVATLDAGSA